MRGATMNWEMLEPLRVRIESCGLEPLERETASGWTRHTTVVHLGGDGQVGVGEDVVYEPDDQRAFQRAGAPADLTGEHTLGSFSELLDSIELYPDPPSRPGNRDFRRWAFESAALDLALRQAATDLGTVLGRGARPVEFAASLGLGEPPSVAGLEALRARVPGLRFKVDFADSWTPETVDRLRRIEEWIAVIDFKAHYHGSFEGPKPRADMYAAVAEALPHAWLEDPADDGDAWEALEPHRNRVTWDAVLHTFDDVAARDGAQCINIKPSRFGTIRELCRVISHCESNGIRMYGGGQFELGPGRRHIQRLASLFYPDMPNDVAPVEYHSGVAAEWLPSSPWPLLDSAGF